MNEAIHALGIDEDGESIFNPIENPFEYIVETIRENEGRIRGDSERARRSSGKILEAIPTEAQPIAAGWTIFVNQADPDKDAYKKIFAPLAHRRGMIEKDQPLDEKWFEIEDDVIQDREWDEWLKMKYLWMNRMERPRYVLLLGGPRWFPLAFQIDLSINAFVGRLAFDTLEEYEVYVRKVLELEARSESPVTNEALFMATEHASRGGKKDATFYSHQYMIPDLIASVRKKGMEATELLGGNATKKNFIEAIGARNPAVVFTASHGLGPGRNMDLDYMQRLNGSICFPASDSTLNPEDKRFSAEDIDLLDPNAPLFWGSVFFQFACFGYGTPSESDYSIWQRSYRYRLPEEEFISALPRRLLAHPKGPVAYIGHLDVALVKSIVSLDLFKAEASDQDPRLSPFRSSLAEMLAGRPPAYSMWDMKDHYTATMNYQLNVLKRYDMIQSWGDKEHKKYVDNWLFLTDSKNYLILGDPAARSSLLR